MCVVLEVVEEIAPDSENRIEVIRHRVKSALKQYFFFTIGRRPVILPFIMEISQLGISNADLSANKPRAEKNFGSKAGAYRF